MTAWHSGFWIGSLTRVVISARSFCGLKGMVKSANGLEHVNREIKRRTRVASIFPNPASCVCLDDWMTGKIYLNLQP